MRAFSPGLANQGVCEGRFARSEEQNATAGGPGGWLTERVRGPRAPFVRKQAASSQGGEGCFVRTGSWERVEIHWRSRLAPRSGHVVPRNPFARPDARAN